MKLLNNPFIVALIALTIVAAVMHILSLTAYSIISGNFIHTFNFFNVVSLSTVFPLLGEGIVNFWMSIFIELNIFVLSWIFILKKKK